MKMAMLLRLTLMMSGPEWIVRWDINPTYKRRVDDDSNTIINWLYITANTFTVHQKIMIN